MSNRAVYIDSYFSLPTDLASEMRSWPEFVNGENYAVTLSSASEQVSTSMENDDGHPFVLVKGRGDGPLFYRVLGVTLYALAGHSDDIWPRVMRWDGDDS